MYTYEGVVDYYKRTSSCFRYNMRAVKNNKTCPTNKIEKKE